MCDVGINGYLVKHALLHVGCHDGVDGDDGRPHPAAPPEQIPKVLLCLTPLALEHYHHTLRLSSPRSWHAVVHCLQVPCHMMLRPRPQQELNHTGGTSALSTPFLASFQQIRLISD